MKVARLSAPHTGCLHPQEILLVLKAESIPGPKCDWKDYEKNPVTPSGIEHATFRFVAQCLNHNATACPHINMYIIETGWKGVNRMAVVNTIIKVWVS
jgi:hypothetical protein